MRKLILVAALAALGAAVVASPAFAFDRHFSVLAKVKSGHAVGQNKLRIKEKLLDPDNRRNKVGRDRITCREKPRGVRCAAISSDGRRASPGKSSFRLRSSKSASRRSWKAMKKMSGRRLRKPRLSPNQYE